MYACVMQSNKGFGCNPEIKQGPLDCNNAYMRQAIIQGVNLKKVQVGNDQEKAQSERNSHSKNRGGKN